MPRNDPSLKPFVLDALSKQKYPNLSWLDESSRLFKLTFARFGGRGPWEDDEVILQDYDHLIRRPYEGYSKARVSLTSAVKSSDSFRMVKEIKDGNIFQFKSDIGGISAELNSTLHADLFLTEDSAENHLWPRNSVLTLIECYRIHQEEMDDPRNRKKGVWFAIAELMKERGEAVTAEICSSKWRNLRRTYKVVQERNRLQPERVQNNWEYFDLLQEVYMDCNMDNTCTSSITLPAASFVGPTLICNPPENVSETVADDSDQKDRNAIETIKRYLQSAHSRHCTEVRKLRECIQDSNKLNSEKNEILKNSFKERNLILKTYLGEKNNILKELLKIRKNTV